MIQYLILVFIKVPFYCYFTGTILFMPKDIFPSTGSSEVTEFSAVNQHQLQLINRASYSTIFVKSINITFV